MGEEEKGTQKSTAGEVVKRADSVAKHEIKVGSATERQVLIGEKDGAPNFAMRRFIMGEGGGMPLHTNTVEHEQYVLCGRATVGIGEKVYDVRANDVLYIPADTPHFYQVTEAPF
ncbi:MAG: cupin domain-containing protein, partial [Acidobacteriota bacterium]